VIARALMLLLVVARMHAAERAIITPNGALAITLPADLIAKKEVREQLTSGLTTVFIVATFATDESGVTNGGARVEVRFALWEEQYIVNVIDPSGDEHRMTFASAAAFEKWWAENPLTVSPPRRYGPRVDVRVKLTMLPFSARDQSDTRKWLARTLSESAAANERTAAQSAEVLRVIVETSVKRRPLLVREWIARAIREGR
jgi:hypothetical protein